MEISEYNKKKEEISHAHDSAINKLASEYAFSNNAVKRGDIVSSSNESVQVDIIRFCIPFGSKLPECTYTGPKVTKKNVRFKDGTYGKVYQSMLKKINGKAVIALEKK